MRAKLSPFANLEVTSSHFATAGKEPQVQVPDLPLLCDLGWFTLHLWATIS